jgi:hypothetical protein
VRNLSKNSLKRLLRPANGMQPGYAHFYTRYWFFNQGGAKAWVQSKGRINNIGPGGQDIPKKYLTRAQRAVLATYY